MLSVGNDAKTIKGLKLGILTGILYFAPVALAREYLKSIGDKAWRMIKNVCPFASKGCAGGCLYTAGRGAFTSVQKARIAKTRLFFVDRVECFVRIRKAITALIRKAKREKLIPTVRLNGTSDLPWESLTDEKGETIIRGFSGIQFYDYTKSIRRMLRFCAAQNARKNSDSKKQNAQWIDADGALRIGAFWPANYHLTFSRSETNDPECLTVLKNGGNVAVVFYGPPNDRKSKPESWNGFPVIDGDVSDVRFGDPMGCVVGLTAKGKARRDASGFVVHSSNGGF